MQILNTGNINVDTPALSKQSQTWEETGHLRNTLSTFVLFAHSSMVTLSLGPIHTALLRKQLVEIASATDFTCWMLSSWCSTNSIRTISSQTRFKATWVRRFYFAAGMTEVVVTTGAIWRAKLQSNHHQQTNNLLSTGRRPSCRPTNSVRALKEMTKLGLGR